MLKNIGKLSVFFHSEALPPFVLELYWFCVRRAFGRPGCSLLFACLSDLPADGSQNIVASARPPNDVFRPGAFFSCFILLRWHGYFPDENG